MTSCIAPSATIPAIKLPTSFRIRCPEWGGEFAAMLVGHIVVPVIHREQKMWSEQKCVFLVLASSKCLGMLTDDIIRVID